MFPKISRKKHRNFKLLTSFVFGLTLKAVYVCVEGWGGERRGELNVSDSFYHPAVNFVARILLYVGTTYSNFETYFLLSLI